MCDVTLKYSANTANVIDHTRRRQGYFNSFDSANDNTKCIIHTVAIVSRWWSHYRDNILRLLFYYREISPDGHPSVQASSSTLWFGRDVLGRRSLLYHLDDDQLVLSSVSVTSVVRDVHSQLGPCSPRWHRVVAWSRTGEVVTFRSWPFDCLLFLIRCVVERTSPMNLK